MNDLDDHYERETSICPICTGTIRKMRNEDRWLCDDCARYWENGEV